MPGEIKNYCIQAAFLCLERSSYNLGLTHSLLENKTLRLQPKRRLGRKYVVPCISPVIEKEEKLSDNHMQYKVKLKKTEEGYAVWCPSLPGCW